MSEKYVVIKSSSRRKYHTNPDCAMIKQECREATESEMEYHNYELCSVCQDD